MHGLLHLRLFPGERERADLEEAHCGACVGTWTDVLGRRVGGRLRRQRRHRQVPRRRQRVLLRSDGCCRPAPERDDGEVGPGRADDDPRPGSPRRRRAGRARRGDQGRSRALRRQADDLHRRRRQRRRVRRLGRAGRAYLPVRQDVHRRQRAEPASLLAPAVRRERTAGLGRGVRACARRHLRRAQGRRRVEPDRRSRALAARQRPPRRAEQRVDVAGPLPPGARQAGTARAAEACR